MSLKTNNRLTSYTFDDYLKDKEKNAGRITPASTSVAGMAGRMPTATRVGSGQIAAPSSQNAVISTPVSTPTPTPTPAGTGTGTGSEDVKDEVNSMLTTDNTAKMMNSVATEIMDFLSRGFQYKPKESPLYTILQQQAAKEAEIASGRAYSRAVANAGGFGSSYATLAAEEASRQVMEGLDDQQLALYQAAKEEWDAQYQSKVQQYQLLNNMYGVASDLEEKQKVEADEKEVEEKRQANAAALGMNTDTYDLLVQAGQNNWYDGRDETTLRTLLTNAAAGNPNIDVEAIVNQLTGKTGTTEPPGKPGTIEPDDPLTPAESEAATLLSTTFGATYLPEAMRSLLQSRAFTSEEIEVALGVQKDIAKGVLLDHAVPDINGSLTYVNDLDSALAYGENLNIALSQGLLTEAEYKTAQAKNSKILRKEYVGLGSFAVKTLDEAAKMVRDQIMVKSDFEDILKNIFEDKLEDVKKDIGKKFNNLDECKDVMKLVISLFEFVDDGTLTEDDLKEIIKPFGKNLTFTAFMDKMQKIEGDDDTIDRLDKEKNSEYKKAWTLIKDAMGLSS